MKAGFTLIELILAFMFSSIILTVLFTSFFQINRSSVMTEDIIDMDTRVLILQNQFEKDLSGAFVPVQGIVEKEKKEEKTKDEAAQKKEKAQAVQREKKEKPKPLNDVFYSTNKGETLNELTFISNNPIRVYEHAENVQVKPRVVRIVYRVTPDPKKKGSFILTRQEGTKLNFEEYKEAKKSIKAYEIAENIKNITIEFMAPKIQEKKDKKESDKKQAAAQEKKEKKKAEPVEFETKKEWRSNELREKPEISQLPQFVTIKLTLWDNQNENERSFSFNYKIAAFGQDLVKPEEPKKDEQKDKKETEQAVKKTAAQRDRPTIAELRASIKEFVNMFHGKNT